MKRLVLILLLLPFIIHAAEPTILLSEIAWMGTDISGNDEWIELYNPTENDIDLAGWRLVANDGGPDIPLSGIVPAQSYFLLERTDDDTVPDVEAGLIYTGSLGNSGEWLKLYDAENNLVDEINDSEGWAGGDNTSKQTLERANLESWGSSLEPLGTPGAENSIWGDDSASDPDDNEPDDPDEPEDTIPDEPDQKIEKFDLIFTEIFPDPKGTDENEFIEIKNISSKKINLTGLTIQNYAKQEYEIKNLTMYPESIVVFERKKTNLALNNLKEKITLYQGTKIIDRVEYKETMENLSFQKNLSSNEWQWQAPTPGEESKFIKLILPTAIIYGPKEAQVGEIITFDGSDSFYPEKRELDFFWDFGDGSTNQGKLVRKIYGIPDEYKVVLKIVADKNASTTETLTIKVKQNQAAATKSDKEPNDDAEWIDDETEIAEKNIVQISRLPSIFISEFLPNPAGPDEEDEFIEIYSQETAPYDLTGFKLDDAEGGSKPYVFEPGTIIKPGEFKAFFRSETKIALNNTNDSARLLTPNDEIIDYHDYKTSRENFSFSLDQNYNWQESSMPTPGQQNLFDDSEEDEGQASQIISADYLPFIFITELLPNPAGPDEEGEFIEIFSNESQPFDLAGFKLDDAEGGSKPYVFPTGTIIKPGEFKAFFRPETKIALNNSNEAVRLLAPDDRIIDFFEYEKSQEGISFVLDENFAWQESKTPTPGDMNTLDETEPEDEILDQVQNDKKKEEVKVLGMSNEDEIKQNEPQNKNKYLVAGISSILIIGAGILLKLKNKV